MPRRRDPSWRREASPKVSVGPYYTATADRFTVVNGLYIKVFAKAPADARPIGECGTLTGGGPVVVADIGDTLHQESGQGGTLVDGVYDLTSLTHYATSPGTEMIASETIRISGGGTAIEYVSSFDHLGMTLSVSPSGGVLHDQVVCPADPPSFNRFVGPSYTATPDQFVSIAPFVLSAPEAYTKVFTRRLVEPVRVP